VGMFKLGSIRIVGACGILVSVCVSI